MKRFHLLLFAAATAAMLFSSCETVEPNVPGALVPPTVDEDPSLPSITVNGTRLHAETYGNPDNPIIVVLHGGPGQDYRSMLNCSKFSADGFFVVFYDQRGTGLSRRHPKETYTLQLYIDDLGAVIDHYRRRSYQKVVLMGKSWGAMLATAYVNDRPDAISGLVLIEPGGLTWHDAEEYGKRTRKLDAFAETSNDYLYIDQFLTGEDDNVLDYKAAVQGAADYAKGNRVGNPGPYPFWRKGAVSAAAAYEYGRDHGFDFTTHLAQYTTHILFVYSELNQAYGKSHAEHVSAAYPNVQLVEILGSGHEVPYFGWDKFYPSASAYLHTVK